MRILKNSLVLWLLIAAHPLSAHYDPMIEVSKPKPPPVWTLDLMQLFSR